MIFNFTGIDLCIETCLHISREFYADVASVSIPPHWVCRICFATTPDIVINCGNAACETCFSTLLTVPIAHIENL